MVRVSVRYARDAYMNCHDRHDAIAVVDWTKEHSLSSSDLESTHTNNEQWCDASNMGISNWAVFSAAIYISHSIVSVFRLLSFRLCVLLWLHESNDNETATPFKHCKTENENWAHTHTNMCSRHVRHVCGIDTPIHKHMIPLLKVNIVAATTTVDTTLMARLVLPLWSHCE